MATHFQGRVERLYPAAGITFVRLRIPVAQQPSKNYFRLLQDHENYNALYSLALAAAINGYDLLIRTNPVQPGEDAFVEYMTVDFG